MKVLLYTSALIGLMGGVIACGTDNILKDLEDEDVAEEAAIALENDQPSNAIKLLKGALESDPNNYKLISLLSSAYSQRGGISMVDLALHISETQNDDSEFQNSVSSLWPFLPDATGNHLADVREAMAQLRGIPFANRTDADHFKLAVISTALASLELKSLDRNGDGQLSFQELNSLKVVKADSIIASIQGASGALSSIDGELGESTGETAKQLKRIASEITNTPGADSAEVLTNYFLRT